MPELVSGLVRGPDGEPVTEARVYFVTGPVPWPDVAVLTGEDGTFVLTAPAPGDYVLGCTLPDGRTTQTSTRVETGVGAHVDVRVTG